MGGVTSLLLDYCSPATDWEAEALPIGNGRLGAMLFGGLDSDLLQLNESSLWRGVRNFDNGLFGRDERDSDHSHEGFGAYQNLGWLEVTFDQARSGVNYRRTLDLRTGRHQVSEGEPGDRLVRTAQACFIADLLVIDYRSERPFSGTITLRAAHPVDTSVQGAELGFAGAFPNGLEFAAAAWVSHCDGELTPTPQGLEFTGAHQLRLVFDAHTNYLLNASADWLGEPAAQRLQAARVRADHLDLDQVIADSQAHLTEIMDRATMTWGSSEAATLALPIDQRLAAYRDGGPDPSLEQVFVQYGRYLLACASRPGGLPANLQGIWNDSNDPAWGADFHSNINIQMNYWGALPTGLTEQQLPLFDWVEQMAVPARVATRAAFGPQSRGWTTRTGMSSLGGQVWEWNLTGAAWLAQHFVEQWRFTGDHAFARHRVLPLLTELAQFWIGRLRPVDGQLLVIDGWSPEHGPREDGVSYDQQIVWDLFTGLEEVSAALDEPLPEEFLGVADRLAPARIGSWGQLQEWLVDRDEPGDEHRHTSHLFAVYPGHQITPEHTPELAQAALVSLRARSGELPPGLGGDPTAPYHHDQVVGDSRRSWTWPWRMALFARLGQGDRALAMLRGLLTHNTLPNLFTTHPPMQLDGNYGIVAGVVECLLQSHGDQISVLPALPSAWPQGEFTGLRARGGATVSAQWSEGRLTSVTGLD